MLRALMIARLVSAPLPTVELVMQAAERAGVDPYLVVAMVAVESRWNAAALGDDGWAWGLFQLHAKWHPQFRGDLTAHVAYGTRYLAECIAQEKGSWAAGIARYNSGSSRWASGRNHAARVMAIYRVVSSCGGRYGVAARPAGRFFRKAA